MSQDPTLVGSHVEDPTEPPPSLGVPSGKEISHGERAGVHGTTENDTTAALQDQTSINPPEAEIDRLGIFLATSFPDEIDRTNYQVPETPVDVAIRLLQGLSAIVPPQYQARCASEFCNKPHGHTDIHGWVHHQ